MTFYDLGNDLPEFTDYSMKNRTYRYIESKPQYPFGYGLTYGRAAMSEANLNVEDMEVEAVAENTGERVIEEVIQVYVKVMDSEFAPLNPRLCGFKRVKLNCGEKKSVKIKLDQRAFMVVNEKGEHIKDGNSIELFVGFCQPDETSIQLMGCKPVKLTAEV